MFKPVASLEQYLFLKAWRIHTVLLPTESQNDDKPAEVFLSLRNENNVQVKNGHFSPRVLIS